MPCVGCLIGAGADGQQRLLGQGFLNVEIWMGKRTLWPTETSRKASRNMVFRKPSSGYILFYCFFNWYKCILPKIFCFGTQPQNLLSLRYLYCHP